MRWKLTLEYEGTGFCGWQKQAEVLSVQQVLEESLRQFTGESVTLHAAGRTDAGVHARGQVAHVDLEKDVAADTVRDALNHYARPHKVSVMEAVAVDPSFHARFSAVARHYRYRIINRKAPLALETDRAWHVVKPLDVQAMHTAAQLLIGHHDFSTFRATPCQAASALRTLDEVSVTQEGDVITLATRARSFLYHQVRNMVGSLVLVGTGRWSVDAFAKAFHAADRTQGGPTAPAHGLYFWSVDYVSATRARRSSS